MGLRLSVIIPGYNTREDWWRRCVASVRKACGPEDEIICMDDGSSIMVESSWIFADVDQRIRLIRQANGGLSSARNAAVTIARGEYLSFVDSDDEVCPGVFDKCINEMSNVDADVSIFGVRVIWPDDGLMKDDVVTEDEYLGVIQPKDVKRLSDACLLNYACNKIYRREFLQANGILFQKDGMPCEDIIFNLSCIMAGARFYIVSDVGYVYYRTHGTLLSQYKPTSLAGVRLACEKWRQYKDATSKAKEILGDFGEMSPRQVQREEWHNIWMPGTPFSLHDRWKWLKENMELGGTMAFFKMMLWTFVRRHFYFRPIRRWHIKRLYPHSVNCE